MNYTLYPHYINHTIGANIIWIFIPAILHIYHYNKCIIPLYLIVIAFVSMMYWLDGSIHTNIHTIDKLLVMGMFIILFSFNRTILIILIFSLFFYMNTLNPYITTIDRIWCHVLFRGMGFWCCYLRLVPYKQYDTLSVFMFLCGMYFGTVILSISLRDITYVTRCLIVLSNVSFSLFVHQKMMII